MNKILDYFIGRLTAQTIKLKELGQELVEAREEATALQTQIYRMQETAATLTVPMHKYDTDIASLERRLKEFTDAKVYSVIELGEHGGEAQCRAIQAVRHAYGVVVITI